MEFDDVIEEFWALVNGGEGIDCPCCLRYTKVYSFPINGAMAEALIRLHKAGKVGEWVDIRKLKWPHRLHGHFSKLRFYGFIEPMEGYRDDGSTRLGIWRETEKGAQWVTDASTIPKRANIYDNQCQGLEGERVTIHDVIGERFNYRELMES